MLQNCILAISFFIGRLIESCDSAVLTHFIFTIDTETRLEILNRFVNSFYIHKILDVQIYQDLMT